MQASNLEMKKSSVVMAKTQVSPELWISVEGPLKLQESLKRLNIDLNKITKKDLERMNIEQLN